MRCCPRRTSALLSDVQAARLEIDITPLQSERLANSKPASESHDHKSFQRMSRGGTEEPLGLFRRQWSNLTPGHPGRIDQRSGITADEPPPECGVKRSSEDDFRVPATTGGDAPGFEFRQPHLKILSIQLRHTKSAEFWQDVLLDDGLVATQRSGPDSGPSDILQPSRQELTDRLALVRPERAILKGAKGITDRISSRSPGAPVDRLRSALALLPAKIDPPHPSAVGTFHDAAFAPSPPARPHLGFLRFTALPFGGCVFRRTCLLRRCTRLFTVPRHLVEQYRA